MNVINWLRDIWDNIPRPIINHAQMQADMTNAQLIWDLNKKADILRIKIAVAKKQKKAVKPLQQELERTVQEILRQEA